MTEKVCTCQFCKDYAYLQAMLPTIPEEHRAFVTRMCESFWQADEELGYKKAILDGTWPEAVIHLEMALNNAKKILAKDEAELKFDCKVCEKCGKPMTAKEYWEHACQVPEPPEEVIDPPLKENNLPAYNYDEEVEEDPFYGGSEHMGDFS